MSQPCLSSIFRAARPSRVARDPATFLRNSRNLSSALRPLSCTGNLLSRSTNDEHLEHRTFSTTTPRSATVILKNPRVDEDGSNMTIDISERAAKRLKQITTARPQRNTLAPSSLDPDAHLRVTVTSGGCHGFQYLMSLEGSSKIDEQEDTIFAAEDVGSQGKAIVVMDEPSLELLKGSTIDFTTELIGSQFKIVGNPRAKSSCGCGTSFDIE